MSKLFTDAADDTESIKSSLNYTPDRRSIGDSEFAEKKLKLPETFAGEAKTPSICYPIANRKAECIIDVEVLSD